VPIRRLVQSEVPGDLRGCEAQPLIVPGLAMAGRQQARRDIPRDPWPIRVWAYDANDGTLLWQTRASGVRSIGSGSDRFPRHQRPLGASCRRRFIDAAGRHPVRVPPGPVADEPQAMGLHQLQALASAATALPPKRRWTLEGATYNPGHGVALAQQSSAPPEAASRRAALNLTQGRRISFPFGNHGGDRQDRSWLADRRRHPELDHCRFLVFHPARGRRRRHWHAGGGPAGSPGWPTSFVVKTGNGTSTA